MAPPLNPKESVPFAQRISEAICSHIDAGKWQEDQPLPVERVLTERFRCTRITLREALQLLEAKGRIYRENRRGWFVSPPRLRYEPANIDGFMQYATSQGRAPRTELLSAARKAAGTELAKRMGLGSAKTAVFILERRRWLGRRAVLLERNVLLADWCPQLLKHELHGSLSELLRQQMGLHQARSQLILHAASLDTEQSALLHVTPGMPCIHLQRRSYSSDGSVVELDLEYWRPDALEVQMETVAPTVKNQVTSTHN